MALTEDVHFVEPGIITHGIDAFGRNVVEVQKRLPNAVYTRAGAIDFRNHLYRYHWAIHLNDQLAFRGLASQMSGTTR